MAPRMPPGPVAAYAEIVGRLAHRFADRAGVLAARGLDEGSFGALEREALAALHASLQAGDSAEALAFAQLVVRNRLALLGSEPPEPVTVAAPTARAHPGFAAVAGPIETPPNARVEPPTSAPVDVLDLMETLHSTAGGRPPSST